MYGTVFLTTLLASVSGHLILENPKPFAFPVPGHFNPLEPDGSDWPCKMPAGKTKLEFNGTGPTLMKVGETQSISFIGTAIHGGGSGQLSILHGHEPSKTNSDFRVIKSWEGGFPMANQKGNLQDFQNPTDKLEFTIPTVPPGNYSIAFTWINRISGGTEFYMNCAPISIPGTTGSTPDMNALGDMPTIFMANVGSASNGCTTENGRAEQKAIQYPNPGPVVEHPEGTGNLIKATCDGNPLAKASPSTPPSSVAPPTAFSSPALPSSVTVPAPPAPTAYPSASPSTLLTSVVPAQTSSASPQPQPSASLSALARNCVDGYLLCHPDGVSFSTCTGGMLINKTPLAPGTHCTPGVGQGLTIINSI